MGDGERGGLGTGLNAEGDSATGLFAVRGAGKGDGGETVRFGRGVDVRNGVRDFGYGVR